MWREGTLFGIYYPPLLIYSVAALLPVVLIRAVLTRTGLHRWVDNWPLLSLTLYLCLLAALVTWL